jgi:putative transposase
MLRTTPAQYKKEYEWLKEVDSLALANVQLHLEEAYRKFFREPKTGFPRFKSKRKPRQSYTTNVVNNNIRLEGKKLRLPKVGKVKIILHRQIPKEAILKSVTIAREASGKYYASLLCELPEPENQRTPVDTKDAKILGIDYAMHGMGVFSDGTKAEYPGHYKTAQQKLAREQRKLSHCVKGSRNYEKQRRRVARCHEKIRHQRADYQHKLTRKLADQFDAVAVEDLDMKALSQCLHLGKGIMDNGYGAFLQKLSYKLEAQGKELIRIDKWYPSSQICSGCGSIHPEVKDLSMREWFCDHCLQYHDRDINAAVNIREEGRWILKKRNARNSA